MVTELPEDLPAQAVERRPVVLGRPADEVVRVRLERVSVPSYQVSGGV
jgi:hypothetical protein